MAQPSPQLPHAFTAARQLSMREQIYLRLEQIRGYQSSIEYLDSLPDHALIMALEIAVQQHRDEYTAYKNAWDDFYNKN